MEGGQCAIRRIEAFRQCNGAAEEVGRHGRPDTGARNMGLMLVDEQAKCRRDVGKQVESTDGGDPHAEEFTREDGPAHGDREERNMVGRFCG